MKRYAVAFSNTKDFFVFKILGYTRDSVFYTQMIAETHWVYMHNILSPFHYPQR
jgi:hypothetical protein